MLAVGPQAFEERPNLWQALDGRQVAFLQYPRTVLLQGVALLGDLRLRQEHRHQEVSALTDLPSQVVERDVVTEVLEGILPGTGVLGD